MKKGGECGLSLIGFEDYQVGDIIDMVETAEFVEPT